MHTHRRINTLLLCMILLIYKTGACVPNTHNLKKERIKNLKTGRKDKDAMAVYSGMGHSL